MATRSPWFNTAGGLALALLLVALLLIAGDLVVMLVFAAVLAYLLFPLVNALEARGWSRTLSATTVFLGLSGVLAVLVGAAVPILAAQASAWQERWADGRLYSLLERLERDLATHIPLVEPGALGLSDAARRALADTQVHLLGYAGSALSLVADLVVVPFVLFFLLRDGAGLMKRLVALVPNRYFEFTMGVVYKIDAHLGGYLRGQSLVALTVGVLTTIGLGLIGVDYYVVLGLFTGLANFIPYVGFVISAGLTLAVSVMTTEGFSQVLGIIIVFGVVQGLENLVLQPWITGRNVSMHPVAVLLAILIGGRAAGVLGMAFAIPTFAILKVVVTETFVNLRRYRI